MIRPSKYKCSRPKPAKNLRQRSTVQDKQDKQVCRLSLQKFKDQGQV